MRIQCYANTRMFIYCAAQFVLKSLSLRGRIRANKNEALLFRIHFGFLENSHLNSIFHTNVAECVCSMNMLCLRIRLEDLVLGKPWLLSLCWLSHVNLLEFTQCWLRLWMLLHILNVRLNTEYTWMFVPKHFWIVRSTWIHLDRLKSKFGLQFDHMCTLKRKYISRRVFWFLSMVTMTTCFFRSGLGSK